MLLNQNQIDNIRDLIKSHFGVFILENLGEEALSDSDIQYLSDKGLLDENITKDNSFIVSYLMGKHRGSQPQLPNKQSIKDFVNEYKDRGLTQHDLRSINHVRQSAGQYIRNLQNTTEHKVVTSVLDTNKERVLDAAGEIVKPTLEEAIRAGQSIQEITSTLRDMTGDLLRDWKRVAVSEMNSAYNQGAIDMITDRNKDVDKNDILVYAQGPLDGQTCGHCLKQYHDGGSFKIYRLSELLANGTNMGIKAADWQAIVPPMHPNCRHRLNELLPGWTLDESGKQVFVHPDHHEFNNNLKEK